jgi:hypothetical protein
MRGQRCPPGWVSDVATTRPSHSVLKRKKKRGRGREGGSEKEKNALLQAKHYAPLGAAPASLRSRGCLFLNTGLETASGDASRGRFISRRC